MIARLSSNRITSCSASLFDAGNPKQIDCSNYSPVGDSRKRPTPDPDDRKAPSTCKIHHLVLLDSVLRVGGCGTSVMKSAMTCHFMDNLG